MLALSFGCCLQPFRPTEAVVCATHLQSVSIDEPFRIVDDTLLFRGTLSWRELVTELKVGKKRWEGGGTVHKGFGDLYSTVRADVMDAVRSRPVSRIAGHSLGGVFAVLCQQDILRESIVAPPSVVYTFGTPRIGDKTFTDGIISGSSIYRVANTEDIVTRLPPLCNHVGQAIELQFDDGSIVDNHSLEGYVRELESMPD